MKKMMLALVALGLLGGGAAGAYMYFNKPVEAAQTEKGADHASKSEAKEGELANPSFVQLEALVLPVMDEDGVSQVISLVVALEVKDEATVLEVQKLTPRLKDAYIQDMYGVLSRNGAMEGGVLQVGAIKARLNKVSTKVLGENVVKDVLLQVVQQRPI